MRAAPIWRRTLRRLGVGLWAGALLAVLLIPAGTTGALARTIGPAPAPFHEPLTPSVRADPPRPLAAMTLGILGLDPASVSLNWTPTTSLTFSSYSVLYSVAGAGGPWQSAAILSSQSTTSYAPTGLTPGGQYWWQIAENDALLGTQYSNVVNATQPTLAFLTASLLSSTDVQLNWTNNASYGGSLGFESYQLFEVVGTAAPSLAATVSSVGTRTATVTGLSPGGSYRFYLNTTDCYSACGGAAPGLTVSQSNSVTLGVPLALSATVTATRPIVDVGQLDQLTCTPSGGQSPYTFAWDLGNGTFAPAPSSVSTSFANSGPMTVTCRITDAVASQATNAVTIVVAPDPQLAVEAAPTIVDLGQGVRFGCTPSLGVSPFSVSWAFGDGQTVGTANTTHLYAQAGGYVATCFATDATGTSVSDHVSISVNPALAVTVAANSSAAAPGSNVTLAALPVNGSGVYVTFNWSFGDGSFANLSGATVSHAFASVGNFTVTAEVTDTLGGNATGTSVLHVTALTVTPGPLAGSAETGESVTFSATALGGAGAPYVFTWRFGDGTGAVGASVTHAYRSAGSFTPTLTVTDRLGASTVLTLPTVTVTAPPSSTLLEPWILLLVGVAAGIAAGAVGWVARRRAMDRAYPAVAGRVPAASPARVLRGTRVCRTCGRANPGLRETCEVCGASLPRGPAR